MKLLIAIIFLALTVASCKGGGSKKSSNSKDCVNCTTTTPTTPIPAITPAPTEPEELNSMSCLGGNSPNIPKNNVELLSEFSYPNSGEEIKPEVKSLSLEFSGELDQLSILTMTSDVLDSTIILCNDSLSSGDVERCGSQEIITASLSNDKRSISINIANEKLNPNSTYRIRVSPALRALDGSSFGCVSDIVFTTGKQKEVIDDNGGNNAFLAWNIPIQRENGNALAPWELGGYEVRYRKLGDADFIYILIEDPYITEKILTLSQPGEYEFQIAAFDLNGLYSQFVKAGNNTIIY